MKKLVLSALCALAVTTSNIASADVKVGVADDFGLSIVAQFNDNINLVVGDTGYAVDYLFHKMDFEAGVPTRWYVGAGGWKNSKDGWGVRVPLGVEWTFVEGWDTFFQVNPNIDFDSGSSTELDIDASIGIRFAF